MFRLLTPQERALIELLLGESSEGRRLSAELKSSQVREMDDGGMGSVQFAGATERSFGYTFATVEFADDERVDVVASLLLDQAGQLFELDVWKVDFSPLQRMPPTSELRRRDGY